MYKPPFNFLYRTEYSPLPVWMSSSCGDMMNSIAYRWLSVSATLTKEVAKNLKGRSKSSQDWLVRQLKDPYVEKARRENYRCRSAFKLLEINERFSILRPGQCVVDIGAAPGSWTQIAVSKTNSSGKDKARPKGFVVGLDRLALYPVEGAVLIGGCDFTVPEAERRLLEALDGRKVDVVLSDMAPNATGIKSMDHDAIISLVNKVLRFSEGISADGASLLMKVWEGRFCRELERDVTAVYETARWVKPKSSRSDSAETFILGRGFKGTPPRT
uniref:rRNA methyltransferase 2, mitochondrial n=1 Tax=Lygus hesperus TaxID=30085 RepID=A0A146M257_LYGHE